MLKIFKYLLTVVLVVSFYQSPVEASATIQDSLPCGTNGPRMIIVKPGILVRPDKTVVTSEATNIALQVGNIAVSATEVTNSQIYCFRLEAGVAKNDLAKDDFPAVDLSWNEASKFAQWLSKATGRRYRLPTQSEWEYLARAGSLTNYPWGDVADHNHANYGSDQCCSPYKEGRDQFDLSGPVKQFPPNGFGLYDVNGNVWELTQDGPSLPVNSKYICGGSWGGTSEMIRSSNCGYADVDYKSKHIGVRLVMDLTATQTR